MEVEYGGGLHHRMMEIRLLFVIVLPSVIPALISRVDLVELLPRSVLCNSVPF